MRKKVACASCRARISRTFGVFWGEGPSSKDKATMCCEVFTRQTTPGKVAPSTENAHRGSLTAMAAAATTRVRDAAIAFARRRRLIDGTAHHAVIRPGTDNGWASVRAWSATGRD